MTMAGSLQDQFLAAGLIKKQKANNIKTAKKKAVKQSRANKTELVGEAAELANKAQEAQRKKSQDLNQKRKLESEKKSVQAQIRQIITLNSIDKAPKDLHEDELAKYNFTHNSKIKTLLVSSENHDLITRGVVAIVSLDASDNNKEIEYYLIPATAAQKINQRDSRIVVLLNDFLTKDGSNKVSDKGSNNTQEDDPYAGFEVPDDLMW
jgi:uncharacterized protein YaiL (DUF2058 family)